MCHGVSVVLACAVGLSQRPCASLEGRSKIPAGCEGKGSEEGEQSIPECSIWGPQEAVCSKYPGGQSWAKNPGAHPREGRERRDEAGAAGGSGWRLDPGGAAPAQSCLAASELGRVPTAFTSPHQARGLRQSSAWSGGSEL